MERRRRNVMSKRSTWGDEWKDPASVSPDEAMNSQTQSNPAPTSQTISAHESQPPSPLLEPQSSQSKTMNLSSNTPSSTLLDTELATSNTLASFKDRNVKKLIQRSKNFHEVPSVCYSDPNLSSVISEHQRTGVPLIIEEWHLHKKWPEAHFKVDWLRDEHGHQNVAAHNVCDQTDRQIQLSDLIDKLRASPKHAIPLENERLYGKDIQCPEEWTDWIQKSGVIPSSLLFDGCDDTMKYMPGNVQTLMCHLGIGDTFTPFHKDLCASSGQNLMSYAEANGSSIWYMTQSSAAYDVAEYMHELDFETQLVTVEELEKAPFGVYIAEQVLGDLMLIPPRSYHQVFNRGGLTVKTSWSRMTVDGLATALYHELPLYRRICCPETYRVKANIYQALRHYTREVENNHREDSERLDDAKTLRQLLGLLDDIIAEESNKDHKTMSHVVQAPGLQIDDANHITCHFCGGDIFQSFFECRTCTSHDHDSVTICPYCYVEGRTCRCGVMKPMQSKHFSDLIKARDRAEKAIQVVGYKHTHTANSKAILSPRPTAIFEAACTLNVRRNSQKKQITRTCCLRKDDSPCRSPMDVIPCKSCHMSRCLSHVLDKRLLHSAEAISIHHNDRTGWHQQHSTNASEAEQKELWSSIQSDFRKVVKEGTRPNMNHTLTYLATKFTTCKPILPANTKQGWYDKIVQITNVPASAMNKPCDSIPLADDVSDLTELSTIADEDQLDLTTQTHMSIMGPVAIAVTQASSTPVPVSTAPKRKFFIQVPKHGWPSSVQKGTFPVRSSDNNGPEKDVDMRDNEVGDNDASLYRSVRPSTSQSSNTSKSHAPPHVLMPLEDKAINTPKNKNPHDATIAIDRPTKKARLDIRPATVDTHLPTSSTGHYSDTTPPHDSTIMANSISRNLSPHRPDEPSEKDKEGSASVTATVSRENDAGLQRAYGRSFQNDEDAHAQLSVQKKRGSRVAQRSEVQHGTTQDDSGSKLVGMEDIAQSSGHSFEQHRPYIDEHIQIQIQERFVKLEQQLRSDAIAIAKAHEDEIVRQRYEEEIQILRDKVEKLEGDVQMLSDITYALERNVLAHRDDMSRCQKNRQDTDGKVKKINQDITGIRQKMNQMATTQARPAGHTNATAPLVLPVVINNHPLPPSRNDEHSRDGPSRGHIFGPLPGYGYQHYDFQNRGRGPCKQRLDLSSQPYPRPPQPQPHPRGADRFRGRLNHSWGARPPVQPRPRVQVERQRPVPPRDQTADTTGRDRSPTHSYRQPQRSTSVGTTQHRERSLQRNVETDPQQWEDSYDQDDDARRSSPAPRSSIPPRMRGGRWPDNK